VSAPGVLQDLVVRMRVLFTFISEADFFLAAIQDARDFLP
jgi:hypothetical protein